MRRVESSYKNNSSTSRNAEASRSVRWLSGMLPASGMGGPVVLRQNGSGSLDGRPCASEGLETLETATRVRIGEAQLRANIGNDRRIRVKIRMAPPRLARGGG
jgi:hypothetical protein